MPAARIQFGFPDEWKAFEDRHPQFVNGFKKLTDLMGKIFTRSWETAEPLDRVVFFLGRTCWEDFLEILLLCGNGYGIGGQKLVRGMFERALTARYLHDHPEELDLYLDYYWVGQMKIVRTIEKLFGEEKVSPANRKRATEEYARVKENYPARSSDNGGESRPNYTWTKLDVVSMAQRYAMFRNMLVEGYLLPTQQAHASVFSFVSRGEHNGSGIAFQSEAQRQEADLALYSAHKLALETASLQSEHFGLSDANELLEECQAAFLDEYSAVPPPAIKTGVAQ